MYATRMDPEWTKIVDTIRNCPCSECNRRGEIRGSDFKVILPRASASNIKYFFISQDPAYFYVSAEPGGLRCQNGEEIRDRFIGICKHGVENSTQDDSTCDLNGKLITRKVTNFAKRILDMEAEGFDPTSSPVYWTHTLKCPPVRGDHEYRGDYVGAKKRCMEYLKMELDGVTSKEFCVVAIGGRALEMTSEILGLRAKRRNIVNYELTQFQNKKSLWSPTARLSREISTYAFVHPSVRNMYDDIRRIDPEERGILKTLFP